MREAQQNGASVSASFDRSPLDLAGKADSVAEVRQVVLDSEVISQPPTPGWGDWVNHLASRMLEAVAEWIGGSAENVALFARVLAFSLLAALALVLVAAMLRAIRRAQPSAAAPLEVMSDPVVAESPSAPSVSEAPVEELLASGDARAALRSVWWALAEYLGIASPRDASWTGRGLLRRSGREELLPLVRDLERATYGRDETTSDAVRELWRRTAAVIGSGSSTLAGKGGTG